MLLNVLILFFSTLLAGLVALIIPKINSKYFYLGLVFSGAFLFSITIVHLLPELFSDRSSPGWIGLLVLLGFFMQLLLDFFTSGVEHGHLHLADEHHQDDRHMDPERCRPVVVEFTEESSSLAETLEPLGVDVTLGVGVDDERAILEIAHRRSEVDAPLQGADTEGEYAKEILVVDHVDVLLGVPHDVLHYTEGDHRVPGGLPRS